jgi:O-antigen biosynthesis protein
MMKNFKVVIDKVLPISTRRRSLFRLVFSGFRILLREGPRSFSTKAIQKIKNRRPEQSTTIFYPEWIIQHEPPSEKLVQQQSNSLALQYRPKISLILSVWNSQPKRLEATIESVINQTYNNWELCLADGHSKESIVNILQKYSVQDPRIKVLRLAKNQGISQNSNAALSLSSGEFVGLLDPDDLLAPFALYEMARLLNEKPEADFIYSDEDRMDSEGIRYAPFFKPDWSPDLLFSFMYTGHFTVYRRSLVNKCGGFRSQFDFSPDYDLALRISEKTHNIYHIPLVLYHGKAVPRSLASGGNNRARQSNLAALQSALERRNYHGQAIIAPPPYLINRIKFKLTSFPLISVIMPTDDQDNTLHCLKSILEKTTYPNFEIIVVTNSLLTEFLEKQFKSEPRVKTCKYDKTFNFSEKCNSGASMAIGDYLVFLNDDMELITDDWLQIMVEQLQRPEIGAVSPKLVYSNQTIQHAGLVTGVRGITGTAFHCRPRNSQEYHHLIQSTREVSALSAACLMMRRDLFHTIQGFDQVNTPVMHSDIDLCFRIRERGYLLLYTPFAELKHIGHVSLAKMPPKSSPDKAELYIIKRFPQYCAYDPYYPPNMRDFLYETGNVPFNMFLNATEYWPTSGPDVLLVSHDLSMSGAPIVLFSFALFLKQNNYFVTVVSPLDGPLASKYRDSGIPLMIDASILDNPLSETITFMASFDLILANTILAWRSIAIAQENQIPVMWMIHESEFGQQLAANNSGVAQALADANVVAFPSQYTARLYQAFHPKDNFRVLYCGFEKPDFPNPPANKSHLVRILSVGTIEPRKGQDILIKSIESLPLGLQQQCEFIFVGRKVSGYQSYFDDFIHKVQNRPNIHYLNQLMQAELFEYYRTCDIFVCSSRDEALPLTLIEAMSQGKAVIASGVGGIPELISNHEDGIIVPGEDAGALSRALSSLIENPDIRRTLGQKAGQKYLDNFTMEKCGERLLEIISPLLGKKSEK